MLVSTSTGMKEITLRRMRLSIDAPWLRRYRDVRQPDHHVRNLWDLPDRFHERPELFFEHQEHPRGIVHNELLRLLVDLHAVRAVWQNARLLEEFVHVRVGVRHAVDV